MDKSDVRRRVKAQKALLEAADRADAALRAFARLETTAAFMMAENILMYHSLPDELCTHEFLDKWHDRKHFYLPRVNGADLEILPYDRTRLKLGAFLIEEPDGADTVDMEAIDLVIVPAVAYDRNGNRVGRGRGYYDRLLRGTRATKVGIAYDFQLFDEVPFDENDVPVDIVITDKRFIKPATVPPSAPATGGRVI